MEYAHPRNDHTHAISISFHDTFARKRTRTIRSNAFYRSFAFAKFFFLHRSAFARLVQQFVLFSEKKDFSKSIFFLETNKTKTRAIERVQNATREREQSRERREREKERERKKEHVPVDLRAVCLVRAILTDFLCRFFLFLVFL